MAVLIHSASYVSFETITHSLQPPDTMPLADHVLCIAALGRHAADTEAPSISNGGKITTNLPL